MSCSFFFFSSRRRHTSSLRDWSSDVCSSDLVGHERGAEVGHACFGVTHRRWRIAFDRPKVALSIDKRFAHRPQLRHMDEGGVDYCFAMRMIITAGVAADFRALAMLSIWKQR